MFNCIDYIVKHSGLKDIMSSIQMVHKSSMDVSLNCWNRKVCIDSSLKGVRTAVKARLEKIQMKCQHEAEEVKRGQKYVE